MLTGWRKRRYKTLDEETVEDVFAFLLFSNSNEFRPILIQILSLLSIEELANFRRVHSTFKTLIDSNTFFMSKINLEKAARNDLFYMPFYSVSDENLKKNSLPNCDEYRIFIKLKDAIHFLQKTSSAKSALPVIAKIRADHNFLKKMNNSTIDKIKDKVTVLNYFDLLLAKMIISLDVTDLIHFSRSHLSKTDQQMVISIQQSNIEKCEKLSRIYQWFNSYLKDEKKRCFIKFVEKNFQHALKDSEKIKSNPIFRPR